MRRLFRNAPTVAVVAAALAGVLVGGTVSAQTADARPAPAKRAGATTPGTYVPLPHQTRAVDTRSGLNGNPKGAVRGGGGINPRVTGIGDVPGDESVGFVAVTLTALSPTATGGLVAFPYGIDRPSTTTLQFVKGQRAVTGTTILRVRSGRMAIHNWARSGSVQVIVDVSGYYLSGTASGSAGGIFHPVTPRRFADTRTGQGVSKGRVAAHKKISVDFGDRGGVPETPGALAVTVTALSPTKPGVITGGRPDEPGQGFGYGEFQTGQAASAFVPLRVADGVGFVGNGSAGTVDFVVDVVGYWTLGFAEQADAFQTRIQTRLPTLTIPAGETRTVGIGGNGGVERSDVSAAAVGLHAVDPSTYGSLRAWKPGTAKPGAAAVLQFDGARNATNTAVVPTADNGGVNLTNTSSAAVRVVVDIDGYVPVRATTRLTGKATARYLDGLTGSLASDQAKMTTYGKADGATGYSFVLLDVGAQTVSDQTDSRGDTLSEDHPGVVVAKAQPRLAYTYSHLTDLVQSYTAGYLSAPGHVSQPTIAVGTNNDGVWDSKEPDYYSPIQRGTDWASTITAMGAANPEATVRGANDIEPGFASTVDQALDWEDAYLHNVTVPGPTPLYFNGSADGCPQTWNSGTCDYGWTPKQLYDLASQPGVAAIPQIYVGAQATQWAEISKANGGDLEFAGFLSESSLNPDFLSPAQATSAFIRALKSVGSTPQPGFVADFQP